LAANEQEEVWEICAQREKKKEKKEKKKEKKKKKKVNNLQEGPQLHGLKLFELDSTKLLVLSVGLFLELQVEFVRVVVLPHLKLLLLVVLQELLFGLGHSASLFLVVFLLFLHHFLLLPQVRGQISFVSLCQLPRRKKASTLSRTHSLRAQETSIWPGTSSSNVL